MIELLLEVRFGRGQQGNSLLLSGWDKPEEGFAWSTGGESQIRLPPVPADGEVRLELTLAPFVHAPVLPSQRVEISIGGQIVAQRRLACETTLRLRMPPVGGKAPRLTLRHADAMSPRDAGAGDDVRALGVRIVALNMLHLAARTIPPAPAGCRATTFRFGANEDTASWLGEGWGAPETDYVWAVGRHSVLRLPASTQARTLILDLNPFIDLPTLVRQRVAIGVDGHLLGFVSLWQRTCLGFPLPPTPEGAAFAEITFDNLDAALRRDTGLYADGRPFAVMLCGVRLIQGAPPALAHSVPREALAGSLDDGGLREAVLAATGQAVAAIAAGFESLGFACELGLLQRRLGREPGGLLRFSGMSTPCLIEGLLNGFSGLGRPDTMILHRRDDDDCGYWVEETAYQLWFQTPVSSLQVSEEALLRQLSRALPFLVRKFLEDAILAEKIFVFQRRDETTRPEADAVLAALSVWGDATVLWVQQDGARAGTVERLSERLLHGFVDASGDHGSGCDDAWVSLLAGAWLLRREGETPLKAPEDVP